MWLIWQILSVPLSDTSTKWLQMSVIMEQKNPAKLTVQEETQCSLTPFQMAALFNMPGGYARVQWTAVRRFAFIVHFQMYKSTPTLTSLKMSRNPIKDGCLWLCSEKFPITSKPCFTQSSLKLRSHQCFVSKVTSRVNQSMKKEFD